MQMSTETGPKSKISYVFIPKISHQNESYKWVIQEWNENSKKFNNQIRDSLIHVLIGAFSIILAHYKLRYFLYDFLRTRLYLFCNPRHWRRPLDDELPDLANLNDIHDLRTKEANKNDHIVWLSNSF